MPNRTCSYTHFQHGVGWGGVGMLTFVSSWRRHACYAEHVVRWRCVRSVEVEHATAATLIMGWGGVGWGCQRISCVLVTCFEECIIIIYNGCHTSVDSVFHHGNDKVHPNGDKNHPLISYVGHYWICLVW